MSDFESARIDAYFNHLVSHFLTSSDTKIVCVAHMVPNSLHFLPVMSTLAPIAAVLPKPKSASRDETAILKSRLGVPFLELSREWAKDSAKVVEDLGAIVGDSDVLIVDIGGYFASSVDEINGALAGSVIGVMEGTENGVLEYEKDMPTDVPVITVARSPLKLPEDYLVGSSVVFSVEAILREQAQILQTRTACVIGFGRVGRGVASVLRGRGIATVIHDKSAIAMAEAAAQGYQVFRRLDAALAQSTLVICATGSKSLDRQGFAALRNGAVVATVTSGDSELDLDALRIGYDPRPVSAHITRYDETSTARYFWLVNDGNAANFVHGAVIGPAIQLIEGEKLAAISAILRRAVPMTPGTPSELDKDTRALVAGIWNEHFLSD